ncbi:MAG: ferrous iron transport protein B [Veillonellales bacterium]
MQDNKLTIALAGNPNSGKTTIFNNLTGSHQHVGNYPGVTVEKKEGFFHYQGREVIVVDLPGTYSLTAFSPEEVVTRDFIAREHCDVLVNVVDASNLERNLYLTTQLLELGQPMVLALNMVDVAASRHIEIREKELEKKLGIPVIRVVGNRREGMEKLLGTVIQAAGSHRQSDFSIDYGEMIEDRVEQLIPLLANAHDQLCFPTRWLALKLLENDQAILAALQQLTGGEKVIAAAQSLRGELTEFLGDDPELEIANRRYWFIGEIYRQVVSGDNEETVTASDKIDRILTNRMFGLPIFLGMMWLVFNLVFTIGDYPKGWMDQGVKMLAGFVGLHMAAGDLKSLVVDGIIGGVGSVIVFLPNILLLFLGIALLEDTGYMARAAFIMDRVMHSVGLHGKSFIPLLLGFGCNVPAIMGTRTLENPRDRLVTMLVAPLMSCSARLPIYTVLIAAFFSETSAGNVLFSIYLLGIVLAVVMARIFRSVLFQGDTEPFVMELPPYRLPSGKGLLIHMWERSVLYVKKAGTIILAVSIIIWFLSNYPSQYTPSKDYASLTLQADSTFSLQVKEQVFRPLQIADLSDIPPLEMLVGQISAAEEECSSKTGGLTKNSPERIVLEQEKQTRVAQLEADSPNLYLYASRYMELKNNLDAQKGQLKKEQAGERVAQSYVGRIGRVVEPLLTPLGFDWKIGVGLFAGFTAKEVLVSTLGTIYNIGAVDKDSTSLSSALAADPMFSPLVAYALMVFVLVYSPCLATIAVMKRETNSWKWPLFSSAYSTGLAWLLAFVVYQGGRLLGLG